MGRANYGLHKTGAGQVATPGRAKQADEEYMPIRLPRRRSSKWPSIVVESGYMDTRPTLKDNAQWWLDESGGDVKGVITTCVSKSKREIVFDLWVSSGNNNDTNMIMAQQSVTVTKISANATTRVSGGPFVVAFEDLFLRPADGPEHDLVFDDQDLTWIAETTWDIQFSSH